MDITKNPPPGDQGLAFPNPCSTNDIVWAFSRANPTLLRFVTKSCPYTCHNIYPISHVHTVPIERCAFLYALVTEGSMCFLSIFIQTIVDIYRSTSKAQKLFFPMYIYRILRFLGLLVFPPLELVHITAPIRATKLIATKM